jgi:hypothetical protein
MPAYGVDDNNGQCVTDGASKDPSDSRNPKGTNNVGFYGAPDDPYTSLTN